jgi:hypothetical protein
MSRVEIFNKCNYKILEIEEILTRKGEVTIDATSGPNTPIDLERFIRNRGGIISSINSITDIARINVQEPGNNAHSIIVVRNNHLKNGWSIFDANGKANLPFKIYSEGKDVTQEYLEVTGESPLNYGSDKNNPGYCGTIGIIFMVYFMKNKTDPDWVKKWINLYNILSTRISATEGTEAVKLSAEIQNLVHKTKTISDAIIDEIDELINNFIDKLIVRYTQEGGSVVKYRRKLSSHKSKNKKTKKRKIKKRKSRKNKRRY